MQQPNDEQIAAVMNEARLDTGNPSAEFFGSDLAIFTDKVMASPRGRSMVDGATLTIMTLGMSVGVSAEVLSRTFLSVLFMGYKLGLAAAESEALHHILNVKDPNADAGRG